jgi:hypothetical protein
MSFSSSVLFASVSSAAVSGPELDPVDEFSAPNSAVRSWSFNFTSARLNIVPITAALAPAAVATDPVGEPTKSSCEAPMVRSVTVDLTACSETVADALPPESIALFVV